MRPRRAGARLRRCRHQRRHHPQPVPRPRPRGADVRARGGPRAGPRRGGPEPARPGRRGRAGGVLRAPGGCHPAAHAAGPAGRVPADPAAQRARGRRARERAPARGEPADGRRRRRGDRHQSRCDGRARGAGDLRVDGGRRRAGGHPLPPQPRRRSRPGGPRPLRRGGRRAPRRDLARPPDRGTAADRLGRGGAAPRRSRLPRVRAVLPRGRRRELPAARRRRRARPPGRPDHPRLPAGRPRHQLPQRGVHEPPPAAAAPHRTVRRTRWPTAPTPSATRRRRSCAATSATR